MTFWPKNLLIGVDQLAFAEIHAAGLEIARSLPVSD
jgi:hypothetical protein